MSSNSLLSISNLTVEFGGLKALDDIFLNLESNQVVGLIGPNVAGKTTLFNAICGLVKPTSGTLALNGKEHDWPATHDLTSLGISRTLQGVGLFPDLTVAENVMIGAQKFARTGLIFLMVTSLRANVRPRTSVRNGSGMGSKVLRCPARLQ